MQLTRLSLNAMATRFEIALWEADPGRLRAAGEEALREIERLDAELSFYRPDSELSRLNASAGRGAVRAAPEMFRLLSLARELHHKTDGAFDVTIGPLMRAWGLTGGAGKVPGPGKLEQARAVVGMQHIVLDDASSTVSFDRQGVRIDLGAIGKGYAIERAAEMLVDSGVTSGIIHGGTSAAYGIGTPPGQPAWRVGIRNPDNADDEMECVDLVDNCLCVSAVHGKSFSDGGKTYGHVIDPRSGMPVDHTPLAAVTGPSSTVCDALSTALLVLGKEGLRILKERFPGYGGLTAGAPKGRITPNV
jgi:thiamine biosynthesis lipoprotein